MKNKIYIPVLLLVVLIGNIFPVKANDDYRERTYVQTDKMVYLAGELVWLKMFVTDDDGRPSMLSKVGYIELLDQENSLIQTKLEIKEGTGSGTIEIPSTLPTGNYRLVSYTRFMNNEGEEVFGDRIISIINTFRTDKTVEVISASIPVEQKGMTPVHTIDVTTDKNEYTCRSEAVISVDRLPGDLHSLTISVAGKDLVTGLPVQTIQSWRNNFNLMGKPAFSGDFLPEYEGHIINASLINTQTNEAAKEEGVIGLLSFAGDDIRLFGGRRDGAEVSFYTKHISGRHEVASVAVNLTNTPYRLDVASPFVNPAPGSLPPVSLRDNWEEQLLQRSVGLQTLYYYHADSLSRVEPTDCLFDWKPDWVYKLDEYTRFTTMEEVVIEFILPLRFRRINGNRVLSVLTEERQGFTSGNTLVLLDGVPLINHELIFRYDPLSVEEIEIYRGKYVFGEQLFDGIAFFKTYNSDYIGLTLDASTQIFDYEGTQPIHPFYMPDYNSPEQKESRLPDYRHTLLWMPEVNLPGAQKLTVPFYTSDLTGEFTITIEGITKSGKTVFGQKEIEVK